MHVITLALNLLLLFPSVAFAAAIESTVVKVADGDTITVLDASKHQHRVRIAGLSPARAGHDKRVIIFACPHSSVWMYHAG